MKKTTINLNGGYSDEITKETIIKVLNAFEEAPDGTLLSINIVKNRSKNSVSYMEIKWRT